MKQVLPTAGVLVCYSNRIETHSFSLYTNICFQSTVSENAILTAISQVCPVLPSYILELLPLNTTKAVGFDAKQVTYAHNYQSPTFCLFSYCMLKTAQSFRLHQENNFLHVPAPTAKSSISSAKDGTTFSI